MHLDIAGIIRTSTRRFLIGSALSTIIATALIMYTLPEMASDLRGVRTLGENQLVALTKPPLFRLARVEGSAVFDTGLGHRWVDKDSGRVESEYHTILLAVGERLLPVEVKGAVDTEKHVYAGKLSILYSSTEAELRDFAGPHADRILAVSLDAEEKHSFPGALAFLAVLLAFVTVSALCLRSALRRRRDSRRHPIVRNLSRYGDVDAVGRDIAADLADASLLAKKIYLGGRWIAFVTRSNLVVARLNDLVWAYAKETRFNGSSGYSVILLERSDTWIEMAVPTEKDGVAVVRGLAGKVPWMELGYGEEKVKEWRTSRDTFLARVDQRKAATVGS